MDFILKESINNPIKTKCFPKALSYVLILSLFFVSCKKEEPRVVVLPSLNPLLNEKKAGIIRGIYEKVYKTKDLIQVSTMLKQGDIVTIIEKDIFLMDRYNIPLFLIGNLKGQILGYIPASSLELSSTVESAKTHLKYIMDNPEDELWLF